MAVSLRRIISSGLFLGYVPIAPGTFGSLLGCLLFALLFPLTPVQYLAFLIAFIFLAIWAADGRAKEMGANDPSEIVIDEVAGMLCAMAFHKFTLMGLLVGFALFRFFDIVKIWPANWAEKKIRGGFGIVLDDVIAGVYANAALFAVEFIALKYGSALFSA